MKRFLDDIFKVFIGPVQDLHRIFDEINKIHPSFKFIMSHTSYISPNASSQCVCPCEESISFLDTFCKISEGQIILDLHKKNTDINMYLPSSYHPTHQHENIPFSLAMRRETVPLQTSDMGEKTLSVLAHSFLLS